MGENSNLSLDIGRAEGGADGDGVPLVDTQIALRRSPRARTSPTWLKEDAKQGPNRGRNHRRRNNRRKNEARGETEPLPNQNGPNSEAGEIDPNVKKEGRRIRRPGKEKASTAANSTEDSSLLEKANALDGEPIPVAELQKRKKRGKRTPYSKKTWQEQMELLDQEAERARRLEEQEQKRLDRLPPLEKLSAAKLDKLRPNAPRNTTQFLIDAHASDEDHSPNDDDIQIDEHGTMAFQSDELLALREELRKKQKMVA